MYPLLLLNLHRLRRYLHLFCCRTYQLYRAKCNYPPLALFFHGIRRKMHLLSFSVPLQIRPCRIIIVFSSCEPYMDQDIDLPGHTIGSLPPPIPPPIFSLHPHPHSPLSPSVPSPNPPPTNTTITQPRH